MSHLEYSSILRVSICHCKNRRPPRKFKSFLSKFSSFENATLHEFFKLILQKIPNLVSESSHAQNGCSLLWTSIINLCLVKHKTASHKFPKATTTEKAQPRNHRRRPLISIRGISPKKKIHQRPRHLTRSSAFREVPRAILESLGPVAGRRSAL